MTICQQTALRGDSALETAKIRKIFHNANFRWDFLSWNGWGQRRDGARRCAHRTDGRDVCFETPLFQSTRPCSAAVRYFCRQRVSAAYIHCRGRPGQGQAIHCRGLFLTQISINYRQENMRSFLYD